MGEELTTIRAEPGLSPWRRRVSCVQVKGQALGASLAFGDGSQKSAAHPAQDSRGLVEPQQVLWSAGLAGGRRISRRRLGQVPRELATAVAIQMRNSSQSKYAQCVPMCQLSTLQERSLRDTGAEFGEWSDRVQQFASSRRTARTKELVQICSSCEQPCIATTRRAPCI